MTAKFTAMLAAMLAVGAPLWAQEPDLAEAEAKAVEEAGSPGMRIPFAGDSIEAFEETLEMIQAETTVAEFTTLQNALDYLLVYDLGARRDRELLYERLDGKTPTEVLEMVKWRQEGRKRDGG
jgi:hypothetical protein